jgi:hypothetical protein
MSTITLETASPIITRKGMGGRTAKELRQPVYTYKGKLVAHMAGKLRTVTVTGPEAGEVDLLAKPVYEFAERPARKELAAAFADVGCVKFSPKASAKPAKAAKPKASSKAAPAKASSVSLEDIVGAIMASDAPMADKIEAIAALR